MKAGAAFFAPPQALFFFFFIAGCPARQKKKRAAALAPAPLRPPPFKSLPPALCFSNFSLLLLFVSHTRFKHPICEFVCAASLLPFDDGDSVSHHQEASSPSSSFSPSSSSVQHHQLTLSLVSADVLVKNFSSTPTPNFANRQHG